MKHWVPAQWKKERGQMLMLTVLLITGFLGLVGLIVDSGFAYAQRRQAQSGADNAALAAARVLFEGGTAEAARAAALEYALANGYDASEDTIIVHIPPISGNHIGDPFHAEVTVQEQPTTFFIHAVIPGGHMVSARGVAGTEPIPEPYALIALNLTVCGSFTHGGTADLSVDGGGVMVNSNCVSDALSKGGTGDLLVDGGVDVNGGSTVVGSGTVSPPPRSVPWIVEDPLADLEPPPRTMPGEHGTPGNPDTLKITTPGNFTLEPGTYYGGIEINCSNCTITLEPGIYVLSGGGFTKSGNPTIVGNEVMIYVTTNPTNESGEGRADPIKITGGGVLDLSPPTTGPYYGITFWQDAQITEDFTISGDNNLVQGLFYAPGARIDLGGGTDLGLVQLVADTIRISGNAPIDLDYGAFRTFEAPKVVLVE